MKVQNTDGFTLLEIMVALVISAIVFTGLFTVFETVTDTAELVDFHVRVSQSGRTILLQMIRDFDSLCPPRHDGNKTAAVFAFKGQDPSETFFSDNATILGFCSASSLSFNSTALGQGVNRVRYVLRKDREVWDGQHERPAELLRIQTPFPGINGTAFNQSITLSAMIHSMQVKFIDDQGMVSSTWNTAADESNQDLPRAVEINFLLKDEQGRGKEFTLVHPLDQNTGTDDSS